MFVGENWTETLDRGTTKWTMKIFLGLAPSPYETSTVSLSVTKVLILPIISFF